MQHSYPKLSAQIPTVSQLKRQSTWSQHCLRSHVAVPTGESRHRRYEASPKPHLLQLNVSRNNGFTNPF